MKMETEFRPTAEAARTSVSRFVWVLVVVGGMLVLASTSCLWARLTLFDPAGFSKHTKEALAHEDVRSFVANKIVDQIIQHGSANLLTVRPLIESVVQGVIATESFGTLFAAAVDEVHRTLFSRNEDTLILGMSDAMIVLLGVIEKLNPDVAAKLPADMQSLFITISERHYAIDLAQFVEDVSVLAYILPGLAVLAFGLALWSSATRRQVLNVMGTALAVVAVIGIAGLEVGRQVVVGALGSAPHSQAAAAVWDVFTGGLGNWMWVVAIAGVLLSAAISSAFTLAEAEASLRRARTFLQQGPVTAEGRLVYAVLLVALGAILVLRPESVLRLAVQLVGLLALYFGICELGRSLRSGGVPLVLRLGKATLPVSTRLLSLVTAVVLLAVTGGLVWRLIAPPTREPPPEEPGLILRCNGYEALCDCPLNEVAFAATHNSMSAASEPGWYFASHDRGIPDQLAAGVRGFLIDTHYGIPVKEGVRTFFGKDVKLKRDKLEKELGEAFVAAAERLAERWTSPAGDTEPRPYLCHGFCELGATDLVEALGSIRGFLERNPHEVVILFFEDYISPDDTALAFERSGLIHFVYTHEPRAPWPTLRQMIERNERVLALSEGKYGDLPRPAWYYAGFELVQETPFRFHSIDDLNCEPNRGRLDSPLFMINHWIEKVTPSPADSERMNRFDVLYERVQECQTARGRFPNLVAVNFYARGDLFRVVNELNGVARPDLSVSSSEAGK